MKSKSGIRTWLLCGIAGALACLPRPADAEVRRSYSKQPALQRKKAVDPTVREYFPGRGIVAPPRVTNTAAAFPSGEYSQVDVTSAASLTESPETSHSVPAPASTPYSSPPSYQAPLSTGAPPTTSDVGYEVSYGGTAGPPTVPIAATAPKEKPVEVASANEVEYECADCGCGDVTLRGPSLCEPNGLSRGCDRPHCPCPSDEALSYYRCNFWGHYPTFWRTWPEGFQRYRPARETQTIYDRYRTAATGPSGPSVPEADADLDEQLKELLKQQQDQGPAAPRPEPELLPEDALQEQVPTSPPAPPASPPPPTNPNGRAYYRMSPRSGANSPVVRPVSYWRQR